MLYILYICVLHKYLTSFNPHNDTTIIIFIVLMKIWGAFDIERLGSGHTGSIQVPLGTEQRGNILACQQT